MVEKSVGMSQAPTSPIDGLLGAKIGLCSVGTLIYYASSIQHRQTLKREKLSESLTEHLACLRPQKWADQHL